MKVVIDNNVYLVKYVHIQTGGPQRVSKLTPQREVEPLKRHTECKVLQVIEGKDMPAFVGIGYAKCHPNDNFDKEKGRQLSLKQALKDANFDKSERAIFWEEYRTWGTERF